MDARRHSESVAFSVLVGRDGQREVESALELTVASNGGGPLATAVIRDCLKQCGVRWLDEHSASVNEQSDGPVFEECQLTVSVEEARNLPCLSRLGRPLRAFLDANLPGTWDELSMEVTISGDQLAVNPHFSAASEGAIEFDEELVARRFCKGVLVLFRDIAKYGELSSAPHDGEAERLEAWESVRDLLPLMCTFNEFAATPIAMRPDGDVVKDSTQWIGHVVVMGALWQQVDKQVVCTLLDDAAALRPDLDMSGVRQIADTW